MGVLRIMVPSSVCFGKASKLVVCLSIVFLVGFYQVSLYAKHQVGITLGLCIVPGSLSSCRS